MIIIGYIYRRKCLLILSVHLLIKATTIAFTLPFNYGNLFCFLCFKIIQSTLKNPIKPKKKINGISVTFKNNLQSQEFMEVTNFKGHSPSKRGCLAYLARICCYCFKTVS